MQDSIPKITKAKRAPGVTQVVEHKAMSSNPSTAEKKEKKAPDHITD
jgi:hypothetical protein